MASKSTSGENLTLLEKYGWVTSVRVIQHFYEDVIKDPLLSHLFRRVNIGDLAEHQVEVLTMVMGGRRGPGPDRIHGVHVRLEISDEQFDAMLGHLRARLLSNGFESSDTDRIISSYRGYQQAVVAGAS
ncbi:MAG: hypothetical protein WB245_02660 [Acidimicrobiia bacterium]